LVCSGGGEMRRGIRGGAAEGRGAREFCTAVEGRAGDLADKLRDAACPLSTRGGTRLVRLVRGRGGGRTSRVVRFPAAIRSTCAAPRAGRHAGGRRARSQKSIWMLHRCFFVRGTFLRPARRPGAARHLVDGRLEQRRDLAALREPGEHGLRGEGAFEGAPS
jgi:hypothetical protein